MSVRRHSGPVHTYPDILFLSGFSFRPHVSGEAGIRIRNFLNPLVRVEIFEEAMIPEKWSAKCGFFLFGEVTTSIPVLEIGGEGDPLSQFGLTIRGVPPGPPGPSPGSAIGSDSQRNKYLGLGE